MQLEQLLHQRPDLWRGRAGERSAPAGPSTGFAALDRALPWHGWPPASLSEILTTHQGAALALALPMLAAASRRSRWLVLVDPPCVPFAPALAARGLDLSRLLIVRAGADTAWAMEQALRSSACAVVLGWQGPEQEKRRQWPAGSLRRLQLAAAAGDALSILLRAPGAAAQPSPAALRLQVEAAGDAIDVTLLKQRGGRPGARIRVGSGLSPTGCSRSPG